MEDDDAMAAESTEYEPPTALRRARSALLLALLGVLLGAVAAGILGVLVVGLASLIDHALG